MVKLTVVYNLPPGADHEEFLRWRTTTHQRDNMAMEGLVKTDFYVVKSAWQRDPPRSRPPGPGGPRDGVSRQAPYRYMTEAYFPDMETFEKTFFDPDYQAALAVSLERIADPLFLISEEVISEVVR
jgi:hypothetical protein